MIKSILIGSALAIGTIVSIYTISVPSIDGGSVNFNNYQGKKILIVNTASASPQSGQLLQLKQLYQLHHDSLEIVAFPSNSFGKEPLSNAAIRHYMRDSLGITFSIAVKTDVMGFSSNPVFTWLAKKSQNQVTDAETTTDFQKFLVDKQGNLIGIFDSSVSPIGTRIQEAIHSNN